MEIESLLAEISKIYRQAEKNRLEKVKQGDFFNVFNTIGLLTEEVRLHSAFLAELLNPQGTHGLSSLFLKAFLKRLGLPNNYLDVYKVSQDNKEKLIGPVTDKEGGRIDIIIEDGKHAVIIENKIYAEDQKNQLLRYYNYGKENYQDGFILIYLTLDGHEPNECSLGNKRFAFVCLSYSCEIVDWLDECILIANQKPLVKSVIIQYKELLKQITHTDMDTNYSEQLLNTMLKPENVIAVGEMLSVQNDWLYRIINQYIWEPLKRFADEKQMNFVIDINYEFGFGENGVWIYKKEWKHYGIFVWTDRKNDWYNMYIGVSDFGSPKRNERISKKNYLKLKCLKEDPCDGWPYGWEYLRDDIMNWDYDITEKIVSGDVANYIKAKFNEILQEIEEKKIIML